MLTRPFPLFKRLTALSLTLAAASFAQTAKLAPAPDNCSTAPQLCPSLAAAQQVVSANAPAEYPASALKVLYSLQAVTNGITTSPDGRAYILFPRLEGEPGVRLAEVHPDSSLTPFPDQTWNDDPMPTTVATRFERLNAVRFGPDGNLWVVDTGARQFDDPPAPGGAKIVVFDTHTHKLVRSYALSSAVSSKSYVDDIRFGAGAQKGWAYITDAGAPGLILLNLNTGATRRILDNAVSTTDERPMLGEGGKVMRDIKGKPVKVQADQLEVSPDGQFLYFEPASGPIYRVETKYLIDPKLSNGEMERHVTLFVNTPSTGGTAIDASGNLYMADAVRDRILKITSRGHVSVLVASPLLTWGDAMWIDNRGNLLIPAAQMDRTAPMNGGKNAVTVPVRYLSLHIGVTPEAQGEAR